MYGEVPILSAEKENGFFHNAGFNFLYPTSRDTSFRNNPRTREVLCLLRDPFCWKWRCYVTYIRNIWRKVFYSVKLLRAVRIISAAIQQFFVKRLGAMNVSITGHN